MPFALPAAATAVAAAAPAAAAKATLMATLKSVAFKAITNLAISAAMSALQPQVGGQGGRTFEWTIDPDAPIPFAAGRVGVAGSVVHRDTFGPDLMYYGIPAVLSGAGPITGYDSVQADDYTVTFDATGKAITSQYAGELWFKSTLGNQPDVVLSSPTGLKNGAALPGWTSQHKLSGKAAYMVVMGENSKGSAFPTGEIKPLITFRGLKGWDPRQDSTYPGGSGTCRLDNPATWVYLTNPILWALKWSLGLWEGPTGKGAPQVDHQVGGIGAKLSGIDVPAFVAAANIADANGWTVSGYPNTDDDKHQVLEAFLQAGGAIYSQRAGKISCIQRAAPRTSIVTISAADTAGPLEIDTAASRIDRINTIRPRFWSPAHRWQMTAMAEVTAASYQTEDGGKRTRGIDYPFVSNAKQAGQLAALQVANTREGIAGVIPLKPHLQRIRPGDAFTITEPGFVLNGLKCLCLNTDYDPATGVVRVSFVSETDQKYPFALGQDPTPPEPQVLTPSDPTYVTPPLPGDWTIVPRPPAPGGSQLPGFDLGGVVSNETADSVIVEHGPSSTGPWTQAYEGPPNVTNIPIDGLQPGATYYVAVRYRRGNNYSERYVYGPYIAPALVAGDVIEIGGRPVSELLDQIAETSSRIDEVQEEADAALEAAVTTLNQALAQLDTQLTQANADLSAALGDLDEAVEGIAATIDDPSTGLKVRLGTVETAAANLQTGKADASRVTALETTVNAPTTGLSARVAGLQTSVTNLQTGKANASDLTALTTRVTSAEGVNTAQNTRLNTVESDVAGKASTTRVSALEATVNTPGTGLAARTSSLETATANLQAGKADASRVSVLEARAAGGALGGDVIDPSAFTLSGVGSPATAATASYPIVTDVLFGPAFVVESGSGSGAAGNQLYVKGVIPYREGMKLRSVFRGRAPLGAAGDWGVAIEYLDADFASTQSRSVIVMPPLGLKTDEFQESFHTLTGAPEGTIYVRGGVSVNRNAPADVSTRIGFLEFSDETASQEVAARVASVESATANLQTGKADASRVTTVETDVSGLVSRTVSLEQASASLQAGKADASRVDLVEARTTNASLVGFPSVVDRAATGFTQSGTGRAEDAAPISASMITEPDGYGISSASNAYIYFAKLAKNEDGKVWRLTATILHSGPSTRARLRCSRLDGLYAGISSASSAYFPVNAGAVTKISALFAAPSRSGATSLGAKADFPLLRFGCQLNADGSGASALVALELEDVTDEEAAAARITAVETATVNLQTGKAEASVVTGISAEIQSARNGSASLAAQLTSMRQATTDGLAQKASVTEVNNLSSKVSTKPNTFAQPSAPSTSDRVVGDLWMDTDDNNQMYRWSGSGWAAVHDLRGEAAVAELAAARNGSTTLSAQLTTMRQTVADGLAGKASATDFNSIKAEVQTARGGASSLNSRLDTVEADVDGKASATRVTALEADAEDLRSDLQITAGVAADAKERIGSAFFEILAASGDVPAQLAIRSGNNSSIIALAAASIVLKNITNGNIVEAMKLVNGEAYFGAPVSVVAGSRRLTIGAGFGSGSSLVLWFGPSATAISSMTRTNGYFALGTDGRVYYGSTELGGDGASALKKLFSGAITLPSATTWTDVATIAFPITAPVPNPPIIDLSLRVTGGGPPSSGLTYNCQTRWVERNGSGDVVLGTTSNLTGSYNNVDGVMEWSSDAVILSNRVGTKSGVVSYVLQAQRVGGVSASIGTNATGVADVVKSA